MKEALKNILLTFISLLLCLLAGELIMRGVYHYFPNYDFEMWRYASELKQPLPYAGLPFHHFPNRSGNYYGAEIRTNSFGFRDREISILKPEGRKRIIILGDSFALGWGVPFNSIASKQLEQMMSRTGNEYEVINMGIGNYNSSMEVELFKLKGLKLEPDMVALFYFINDTEPTPSISSLSYKVLKRSYLIAYLIESFKNIKMADRSDDGLMEYYKKIYSESSAGMSMNSEAIRELTRLCRDRNIKLLIVNIPDLRRLKGYPFSFATDHIRKLAEDSHVPFLDLLPVFDKYGEKSLWVSPEDPHMNAKANTLTADAIYNKLINERLIN